MPADDPPVNHTNFNMTTSLTNANANGYGLTTSNQTSKPYIPMLVLAFGGWGVARHPEPNRDDGNVYMEITPPKGDPLWDFQLLDSHSRLALRSEAPPTPPGPQTTCGQICGASSSGGEEHIAGGGGQKNFGLVEKGCWLTPPSSHRPQQEPPPENCHLTSQKSTFELR